MPTTTTEPSVEELREDSERTREALAATVGELRAKVGETTTELKTLVSPAHIKREIRNYVREERESLIQSVQRKAKENPLQLAAVGAAVAVPALGLLRAIPTPLLLIGAGLFLTSKRGQATAKDLKVKLDGVVQEGSERVADYVGAVKSDLEDRRDGARYAVEDMQDTVTTAVGSLADKARAAFHDTRDAVAGAAGGVAGKASQTGDTVSAAVSNATSAVANATSAVKDRAAAIGTGSRDAVTDFVNNNALLVAGIGIFAGAFLAASIPSSDAENRLFGPGSKKLKDKAREAAAQGIEKASDLAAEAAGSVATAAAREGLDAAGVQDALNKVAGSVRAVADRGLETALGTTSQSNQQNTSERNPT